MLVAWLGLLLPGSAPATSLRFFGNGENGIDRVKIRIDGPAKPADVGSTDFTLEWWMRALPGDNASDGVVCDANDGWIFGNILFDRDIYGAGEHGDFGVSLTGGRVAFGVGAGTSGNTICGETDVADGVWHHVAVARQRSDGRLRIYVDGVLDAEGSGNVGTNANVSYQDNRATLYPQSDPYLVIGAEKHDAGAAYPSYHGWIDEVRLSTVQRYTASRFTRPFSLFAPDGSTAALYHLDEGAGDTVGDASGGGSHGTREYGGTPPGPEWSSDAAPLDTARRVALEQVISGMARPVAIANAGDDRLFVVEADGRILAYQVTEAGPFAFLDTFLDVRALVSCCGERGLLGLAFHPNYASNGYFFVYYTRAGDGDIVIARYQAPSATSNTAILASAQIMLTIEHSTYSNHNGGGMAFGPDGYLYISVGDGGGGGDPLGSGQNLGTLLGKVLRLDVDVAGDPAPHYEIPPDNPFIDTPGAREEIWAWGLRNPWRIAFDRLTGDLFIGDVGQGNREEVDFQPAGSPGGVNYGWPRMEGTACYSPSSGCQTGSLVLPILDYSHADGCSITGGYRYRGAAIPTLHGVYVFGDFCKGKIWAGAQTGNGSWSGADLLSTSLSISTFGEDAWGELYVAHLGGTIHRFVRVRPRLTVTRSGGGSGTASGPGGMACGQLCSVEYEPGETVTLTAAAAVGSWFAGWSGACGGVDECVVSMDGDRSVTAAFNPRPVLRFSAASYSVNEGSGGVTITVQRLATTAGTVTVDYAIETGSATAPPAADADFASPGGSLTGTLTFTPGQSTKSFTIPIVNDARAEGPETILLSLHNPTSGAMLGAQSTAVLTIVDNDSAGVLEFGQTTYSTGEASASLAVPVQRWGGGAEATVTWTVIGGSAMLGTDFTTPDGVVPGSLTFGANVTGTLRFGANVSSVSIPLTLLRQNDTLADGPRTIQLALSGAQPAGFATLGPKSTATLMITENDSAGVLQFSPATLSVSEAAPSGKAVLTVARGQAAGGVAVDWAVVPEQSTAVLNTDYGAPTSGTLNFAGGILSQPIEIPLLDPPGVQGSRTVRVRLSNPSGGATLGAQKTATLTITDDDIGLQFSQASYTASEGSGSITIPVVRTGPGGAVSVAYAAGSPGGGVAATASALPNSCTPGADYLPVSGTLTFGPNDMSKSFTMVLCRDGVVEPAPKVVGLTLSTPQPGGVAHLGPWAAADLTINNVDAGGVLRWSSATYSVNEGAGPVFLTVTRSGGSAGSVSVDYAVTGGTATAYPTAGFDFTGPGGGPPTGTLNFAAGVMSQTLTLPVVNDSQIEPNETFTVTLQNPHGGATVGSPGGATVTIVDNDRTGTVQFSQGATTAQESAARVTLTVTRSGSTSGSASVAYQITGDTAEVTGSLTGTVTFPAGQSSQSLQIPLQDDAIMDGNSTLTVTLMAPPTGGLALGTPNPATVTLVDDEGTVQFGAAVFTVSEGSGSATVTVARTGGTARAVTVNYATGDPGDSATAALTPGACSAGADYRPIPNGSLTFNPGETSKTFSIQLCGDNIEEGTEALTLRLTGVTLPTQLGAQSTAVLQIQENDEGGLLRFSGATYSVTEGTAFATLTVLRSNGTAGGVTLPWSITGGTALLDTDYGSPNPAPLTLGPNQASASITIPILNDSLVDGSRTVVVTLGTPTGGATLGSPSTATLIINDNEPAVRFSSATYSTGEGSTGIGITVQRGGATNSTVTVDVQTTGAGTAEGNAGPCGPGFDFTAVSLPVTFNSGETSKMVTIPLCPDTDADGTETIGLALANPSGATLGTPNTATVTVTENDVAGTLQFATAATSASEAQGTANVLVTRAGGSASAVTAHWTVAGGSAVHGVDYSGATSGTLIFGVNQMSQSLQIPVEPRAGAQGLRTVTLLLDAAGGGGTLGAQTGATLWILDAD